MNLKGFLIIILLAAISFAPAAGAGMPGDENGDSVLSRQELSVSYTHLTLPTKRIV